MWRKLWIKDFETELLTSDVKDGIKTRKLRQPDIEESGEMKQKVKKLNSLLKKIPQYNSFLSVW